MKFEEYPFDVRRLWDVPSDTSPTDLLTKRRAPPREPAGKVVPFPLTPKPRPRADRLRGSPTAQQCRANLQRRAIELATEDPDKALREIRAMLWVCGRCKGCIGV